MDNNSEILIESFKQKHSKENHNMCNSIAEAFKYLSSVEYINESNSITEQSSVNFYTNRALNIIQESIEKENTFKWPYNISPYFSPEEIIQFENYYADGVLNKESVYRFEPIEWNNRIINLMTRLKLEQDIDNIKQEIINLGWNPEIEYNAENQIRAKKRIESLYQERYKNILTLDLTSFVETSNDNENFITESYNGDTRPIHVVVVKGDSPFSNAITKFTNSQFSHSAICVDNNFNNLYSFNLNNGHNFNGGFSIEKIDEYPKENRLAVFSFFVNKVYYDKIVERIEILTENINNTAYNTFNILLMPFKNINLNIDNSMICSQFVDSILKMANINITNKDSSHVVPNDFYKASMSNNSGKIYKVFDGIVKEFNPKKIINYVNRMSRKVKPVSENASTLLDDFIYPTLMEARLPIQFNRDGDILLTNVFIDFDREYSASHKLLLQYAKNNNLDGMKYELARLYYMNYILERRLYHNNALSNKDKNIKTRARVLNDFNKYLKFILDKEPNFNFAEYYENSIFYPHTVEVKKDTILKLKDIINYIL